MKACEIANKLFELNTFQTYKNLDAKLKAIKESMKQRMIEDEKRKVFISQNVVAKYVRYNKCDIDVNGLQEMLNSYGILVHTAIINTDDKKILNMISPFKNEPTYHIRINAKVVTEEFNFDNLIDSELAQEWFDTHKEMKRLEKKIEKAKTQMMKCEILNRDKSVKFAHGTLSLVQNKVSYNIVEVYNKFGIEFIKKYTIPSLDKINEFIERGFIEQKEVDQFKTLTDIGLKFVMMKLSDEEFVYSTIREKQMNASLNKVA